MAFSSSAGTADDQADALRGCGAMAAPFADARRAPQAGSPLEPNATRGNIGRSDIFRAQSANA